MEANLLYYFGILVFYKYFFVFFKYIRISGEKTFKTIYLNIYLYIDYLNKFKNSFFYLGAGCGYVVNVRIILKKKFLCIFPVTNL